ncbi:MAG TPA: lytic murein transglycosylase [Caulobacteraceae bacterium]
MDRRVFLLLTLAGAADPAPLPPPLGPPSDPSLAPDTQVLAPRPTGDAQFDEWRSAFMVRALAEGLPADVLARELNGLTPDPHVLALETHQPEFSKPVGDYVRGVVSDERVAIGRRKLAQLAWLPDVEARYGVTAEILLAIWAVETAFGTIQGENDALRCLATLAASGHRQDWAETQIIALFHIMAEGDATRAQLKGSWTGALGQPQFEPTQYLSTAVDADGDGRRDIWNSAEDALASAANLLAKAGWRRGQLWAREVALPPGFDYGLSEGPAQPLAAWTRLGLRSADGLAWSAADAAADAVLLTPVGVKGPAFLALPNHFVLRQYNNALAYALAVGLLADRIAGRTPVLAIWPPETPLSLADRSDAQTALARLGFDAGAIDGMIGAKTRVALRAWQKARGIPADGYLSVDVVQRLRSEAGASVTPPV